MCVPSSEEGEEEEGKGRGWRGLQQPVSSEDEFERELEKELMGVLVGISSPDVLAAAAQDRGPEGKGREGRGPEGKGREGRGRDE